MARPVSNPDSVTCANRKCGKPATHLMGVKTEEDAARDMQPTEELGQLAYMRKQTPLCEGCADYATKKAERKGLVPPTISKMLPGDAWMIRKFDRGDIAHWKKVAGANVLGDDGLPGDTIGSEYPTEGRPYKDVIQRGDAPTQGGIHQPKKPVTVTDPETGKDVKGVEIRVGRGNAPRTAARPGRSSGSRETGAWQQEKDAGFGPYDKRHLTEGMKRQRTSAANSMWLIKPEQLDPRGPGANPEPETEDEKQAIARGVDLHHHRAAYLEAHSAFTRNNNRRKKAQETGVPLDVTTLEDHNKVYWDKVTELQKKNYDAQLRFNDEVNSAGELEESVRRLSGYKDSGGRNIVDPVTTREQAAANLGEPTPHPYREKNEFVGMDAPWRKREIKDTGIEQEKAFKTPQPRTGRPKAIKPKEPISSDRGARSQMLSGVAGLLGVHPDHVQSFLNSYSTSSGQSLTQKLATLNKMHGEDPANFSKVADLIKKHAEDQEYISTESLMGYESVPDNGTGFSVSPIRDND